MENEMKMIMEMIQNLTTGMDDMKAELKAEMAEMKTDMVQMKSEMFQMKGEMAEMKQELNQRFDKVDGDIEELKVQLESNKNCLYRIDDKISDFMEVTQHTAELQGNSIKDIRIIQEYHKYKIADLEEDVYLLKNKQ